jgi:hypothetical protein
VYEHQRCEVRWQQYGRHPARLFSVGAPLTFNFDRSHAMQVQVNTDNNTDGDQALAAWVSTTVESALSRSSDHVTRVEVHLSDENGHKSGQDDKRCMMEARLAGHQPVAVSHCAKTLDRAVNGAADKLTRLVESVIARAVRSERSRDSVDQTPG